MSFSEGDSLRAKEHRAVIVIIIEDLVNDQVSNQTGRYVDINNNDKT